MDRKILVLGGASYDDIIHVDEFFDAKQATIFSKSSYSMAGSTGVGKALAFKKLGFDVTLQAMIGKDIYGELIKEELETSGVRFYPYLTDTTERHTNIMDDHGRRITIYKALSNDVYIDVERYEEIIKEADIVVLNIKNYCRKFIPLIKKHQKPIYVDLHDYDLGNPYHQDFIDAADYVFFSSDRMPDYLTFMRHMIFSGKQWVVATHAEKGASMMDQTGQLVEIEADRIELVDTNGAGDNFFAGFVTGLIHGLDPRQSLLMGKLAANACIQSNKITGKDLSYSSLMKKISETEKN